MSKINRTQRNVFKEIMYFGQQRPALTHNVSFKSLESEQYLSGNLEMKWYHSKLSNIIKQQ